MLRQKIIILAIFGMIALAGCQSNNNEGLPQNDFKIHTYYVVPTDKSFSQSNADRAGLAIFEMQGWYQTATGGLTFEILDEENIVEVYFADRESSYYAEDWWNLLLTEMRDKGEPIESAGTIAMIWIEGITQISATATALGGHSCGGNCGAAIMPVQLLIAPTWPPVDMGVVFHEMGHTLGLSHPVEEADLPLPLEEQPILYSVMCQATIRAGTTSTEHGFLTFEKSILVNNPFMKLNVPGNQGFWQTNIINYPVTGTTPNPAINFQSINSNTLSFSTNNNNALLYYWNFGDGYTSNDPAPTHEYSSSQWYNVTLMVTDNSYMANRVSRFVQIE